MNAKKSDVKGTKEKKVLEKGADSSLEESSSSISSEESIESKDKMAESLQHLVQVGSFDPSVISWKRWLQQVKGAFKILKVTGEDRVPYILQFL